MARKSEKEGGSVSSWGRNRLSWKSTFLQITKSTALNLTAAPHCTTLHWALSLHCTASNCTTTQPHCCTAQCIALHWKVPPESNCLKSTWFTALLCTEFTFYSHFPQPAGWKTAKQRILNSQNTAAPTSLLTEYCCSQTKVLEINLSLHYCSVAKSGASLCIQSSFVMHWYCIGMHFIVIQWIAVSFSVLWCLALFCTA